MLASRVSGSTDSPSSSRPSAETACTPSSHLEQRVVQVERTGLSTSTSRSNGRSAWANASRSRPGPARAATRTTLPGPASVRSTRVLTNMPTMSSSATSAAAGDRVPTAMSALAPSRPSRTLSAAWSDHEDAGAVRACQLGQGPVRVGVQGETRCRTPMRRQRPAAAGRAGRCSCVRDTGECPGPIVELGGGEAVRVGLGAEHLPLPQRVVGVLHRQRRPGGRPAGRAARYAIITSRISGPMDTPSAAMWCTTRASTCSVSPSEYSLHPQRHGRETSKPVSRNCSRSARSPVSSTRTGAASGVTLRVRGSPGAVRRRESGKTVRSDLVPGDHIVDRRGQRRVSSGPVSRTASGQVVCGARTFRTG